MRLLKGITTEMNTSQILRLDMTSLIHQSEIRHRQIVELPIKKSLNHRGLVIEATSCKNCSI